MRSTPLRRLRPRKPPEGCTQLTRGTGMTWVVADASATGKIRVGEVIESAGGMISLGGGSTSGRDKLACGSMRPGSGPLFGRLTAFGRALGNSWRRWSTRHGRKDIRQVQASQPPRHRGPLARAAPLLLLRHGSDRGADPPAVRRRGVVLERGR